RADITISWGASSHTYDIRGRKYLGEVAETRATFDQWEPLVFTRAHQPVPHLSIEAPAQVQGGAVLAITLRDQSALPEGSFRIVRLELVTPGGEPYDLYARNLKLNSTPYTERIPLAYNDPKGGWLARARDVMTGESHETAFTVV
ncbi:MAG: hypothetical protein ACRD22_09420, partial [Terriglobia bacterium]